jgi:hypothetical protein
MQVHNINVHLYDVQKGPKNAVLPLVATALARVGGT